MPIYTRAGDGGETGLFGGARLRKSHPRVAAYGTVDELNCALGAARAALAADQALRGVDEGLKRIQEECFVIGALLASPPGKKGAAVAPLAPDAAARLEREIDGWDAELPPLKSFILPGGGPAGAALHVARAVARRAEREVVALSARQAAPAGTLAYLNRLSTWLFVAARRVNASQGFTETPWKGLGRKG